ncbi:MAG: hypothetical protein OEY85_15360, partial [Rhodospirillales bacterium]|nr:hypothetical protein [Rhodospirillales bacterium]
RPGDRIIFSVWDPSGSKIVRHETLVKKKRALGLYYAGKKKKALSWPQGTYRGEVRLIRESGPVGAEDYTLRREIHIR